MVDTKFHIRRKDREITDPEKIRAIIRKATICRLGLMDDKEAYIVPVNFGFEDGCLYFHSAPKGHKVDLIKKNNRICFEIEGDYLIDKNGKTGCDVKYQSVIGRGFARVIEDDDEKVRGIKSIMQQCAGTEFDFPLDRLNTVMVVKVEIDSMTCKQAGF